MKGMYFYNNCMIWRYKNGWITDVFDCSDPNIYKTINDAKNAIDLKLGNIPCSKSSGIPDRYGKPLKIIGTFEAE